MCKREAERERDMDKKKPKNKPEEDKDETGQTAFKPKAHPTGMKANR